MILLGQLASKTRPITRPKSSGLSIFWREKSCDYVGHSTLAAKLAFKNQNQFVVLCIKKVASFSTRGTFFSHRLARLTPVYHRDCMWVHKKLHDFVYMEQTQAINASRVELCTH
jgi:hypothetical protein